jgi:hypothetical protein
MVKSISEGVSVWSAASGTIRIVVLVSGKVRSGWLQVVL